MLSRIIIALAVLIPAVCIPASAPAQGRPGDRCAQRAEKLGAWIQALNEDGLTIEHLPPPSSLHRRLTALIGLINTVERPADATPHLDRLGAIIRKHTRSCPVIVQKMRRLGNVDPTIREEYMARWMVAALKACSCRIKRVLLRDLLWTMYAAGLAPAVDSVAFGKRRQERRNGRNRDRAHRNPSGPDPIPSQIE